MVQNINVYVIHLKDLTKRKQEMERLRLAMFESFKDRCEVVFRYVTMFDPADLAKLDIQSLVNTSPIEDEKLADFNKLLRPMTVQCLSNVLKHYSAYKHISENSNETDINLILEDDIMFSEESVRRFVSIVDSRDMFFPKEWDLMFFGFPQADDNQTQLRCVPMSEMFRVLPGIDSVMVTKKAAGVIAEALRPVKFVGNVQLSYAIYQNDLKAYLCRPNVFIEGSKAGSDVSTLNPNNVLIYNDDYRTVSNIVTGKNEFTEEDKKTIEKVFENSPIKLHPDLMYLRALFYMKCSQFKAARIHFDASFAQYQKTIALLNKESVFLNNYIELCKVLQ
jgi:GR25 family glycosyltransferase involved in LPS biosynthesis